MKEQGRYKYKRGRIYATEYADLIEHVGKKLRGDKMLSVDEILSLGKLLEKVTDNLEEIE